MKAAPRKKKGKNKNKDDGAAGHFASMVRAGDMEIEIVAPKYAKMRKQLGIMSKTLRQLSALCGAAYPEMKCWEKITKFSDEVDAIQWHEDQVDPRALDGGRPKEIEGAILAHYATLKESKHIAHCTTTLSELKQYEVGFTPVAPADVAEYPCGYNDTFITRAPGVVLAPLTFAKSFNLKLIWIDNRTTAAIKKNILLALNIIMGITGRIHDMCMKPDADPKNMVRDLLDTLNTLRNRPEFNRLGRAFKHLENSVDLLEQKYPEYYAQSVRARNPSVILENYINDIVVTHQISDSEKREFSQMVKIIHKDIAKKQFDPKNRGIIQKLSGIVGNAFDDDNKSDEEEDLVSPP